MCCNTNPDFRHIILRSGWRCYCVTRCSIYLVYALWQFQQYNFHTFCGRLRHNSVLIHHQCCWGSLVWATNAYTAQTFKRHQLYRRAKNTMQSNVIRLCRKTSGRPMKWPLPLCSFACLTQPHPPGFACLMQMLYSKPDTTAVIKLHFASVLRYRKSVFCVPVLIILWKYLTVFWTYVAFFLIHLPL